MGLGTVFLEEEREKRTVSRLRKRRQTMLFRAKLDNFITLLNEANDKLGEIAAGILVSLGYHRHHRGNWRLKCDSTILLQVRDKVKAMKNTKTEALTPHTPPDQEPEVVKLFARARKGDAGALRQVQAMIRDRKWVSDLGDIGQEATVQLLAHVAKGDPVWKIGMVEQINELMAELLGDDPSILEKLLSRRVVNGWIAVYTLELEYAAHTANSIERREYLDKAISRAQRRYMEAIHELTRVRSLRAPKILTRALRHPGRAEVHDLLIPMNPEEPAKTGD
jgi:hypothetical protein